MDLVISNQQLQYAFLQRLWLFATSALLLCARLAAAMCHLHSTACSCNICEQPCIHSALVALLGVILSLCVNSMVGSQQHSVGVLTVQSC